MGVFWDAVAYPFPPGLTPDDIYAKIDSALPDCSEGEDEDLGYMGEKSIWVYVDETDKEGSWGGDFGNQVSTSFLEEGLINTRDLLECYMTSIYGPWTLLRPFHVFLADEPNEHRPEDEVQWPASLLNVFYSFEEEKSVSFSRPHQSKKHKPSLGRSSLSAIVQGGQLGTDKVYHCTERQGMVFWNVNKCPIPCDPLRIDNIRSALDKKGFHRGLQFFAFGPGPLDDNQRVVFKEARIAYSQEGEHLRSSPIAETRDYRDMALDLINFAALNYYPAALIVIPKPDPDSELHRVLKCLESRSPLVLVVNRTAVDSGSGQFHDSEESVGACIQGLDGGDPKSLPECWCCDVCLC
ncbi:unnamed protein product [Microthlaspi erraticum]|uniref:NYN domain-containing protein n=1 Tax=Microthlaspi erraticum TaxID=1685480 RepID=A0A6D2IDW7_9BRAS|nr:unnamed protein product [Microthlaspi erraticum]